jgi:protein-disulfide isomerase
MKKLHHHLKTIEGKFVAGLAMVVVLLFAYYFYTMSTKIDNAVSEITISKTDHIRGAQDGKVTLVVFGDFQCPACGAYEPMVQQVAKDNSTVLKVVFKNFPLTQIHQNALLGAKAAEAAGLQGKFWEMHDKLYEKQTEWSLGINARDIIMGYAKDLKLDTAKFSNDINSKDLEDKILAEEKEGLSLGVQGTPTFFLNGKKLENPQSLEAFDKVVREAVDAVK